MGNVARLQDMFAKQGAGDLGMSDTASAQVIANIGVNTMPMIIGGTPLGEISSDDVLIVELAFDRSGSMGKVARAVIAGFNEIIVPAWQGSAQATRQSMMLGGLSFGDEVEPLWDGFVKIEDVPQLSSSNYHPRGMTRLYGAVKDALTAISVYSAQVVGETGIVPKAILVIISDGADNLSPNDLGPVQDIIAGSSSEVLLPVFVGFQTDEPVNFQQIAEGMGIRAITTTEQQPGQTDEDLQRKFRHLCGTVSSAVVSASQGVIGPNSAAGFWNNTP